MPAQNTPREQTNDHDASFSALDHALLRRYSEPAMGVVVPDEVRRGCTSWSSCVDKVSDRSFHERILDLIRPQQIALP